MPGSPEPEPTAVALASASPKFRQSPRELQLMVWKAHLEARPAVHQCFNRRTFGRTCTIEDPAQNALRPVVLAKKEDPDRLELDPCFPALGQNKGMLWYNHRLARPTPGPKESWQDDLPRPASSEYAGRISQRLTSWIARAVL